MATYYNVGNQKYTQSNLNNNMSGNVANDIYRATHQGQLNTSVGNTKESNPGSYVQYTGAEKKFVESQNSGGDKTGGNKTSSSSTSSQITTPVSTGGGYDYAGMINSMLAQQRAAAEQAFNNSRARLESAWGDTLGSLNANRESALNQLRNNYDYSSGQAQDDANKSLREAYVNYMLNKRNMNQNLSAMGVSGGASESSLANMYNSYGNSRNNINTTLADNLAALLNAYQNNVAGVEQAYNSQFADARNNYMSQLNALESALANNAISNYSGGNLSNLANYASTLSNLVGNMANTQWTPTENTLGINTVSTQQGVANDPGTSTTYAKYKALMDDMQNSGASASQIIQQLRNAGASQNDVLGLYGLL